MVLGKILRMTSILNPSVCSLARSHLPFQGRYNRLDLKLQFAIMTNLYMLPERELAKSRSDFD